VKGEKGGPAPKKIEARIMSTILLQVLPPPNAASWYRFAAALAAMLLILAANEPPARAQTLTVLYSFATRTGALPSSGVIRDGAGNLYGTTWFGGTDQWGTVFEVTSGAKETVLYNFTGGKDGKYAYSGLLRDSSGNLYGATLAGGTYQGGAVFKVDTMGKETVLYSFTGRSDGASPWGLTRDSAGNLYGTTGAGGSAGNGVVYELNASGYQTVIYSFGGGNDGATPNPGLVRDGAGNLYGTTSSGGVGNHGTVFKVSSTGKETLLYTFTGGTDGGLPNGELLRDNSGDIYGTTQLGGAFGEGTVFKVDSNGNETVLYSFNTNNNDGRTPSGGVYRDSLGNLYGNTEWGGEYGWGTTYKIDTLANEMILYSFTGGTDGKYPIGSLTRDAAGNLYGTTQQGGASGNGVVFKLTP
jgi:uncharacterized repeat protein (TIGR03803 family)